MVAPGTLFEYLAAFITIVLAIAFGDLATSLHRLIRARDRVVWHPLPLAVALFVLLSLVTMFFEIWHLTRVDEVTYYQLVWYLVPQFVIFLAACAVLPDHVPAEGLRLIDYYMQERPYIFGALGLMFLCDFADTTIAQWEWVYAHPEFYWREYVPQNFVVLVGFAVMAFSRRLTVHWFAVATLFIMAHLGYSTWAIKAPAARVEQPAITRR